MGSCSSGQAPVATTSDYGKELPGSTNKAETLNSEQEYVSYVSMTRDC
jgi:hypothetical protein